MRPRECQALCCFGAFPERLVEEKLRVNKLDASEALRRIQYFVKVIGTPEPHCAEYYATTLKPLSRDTDSW